MGLCWYFCLVVAVFEDTSVGWGSRKEEYVDKKGDPKSIFHKVRQIIEHLPPFLKPRGFNAKDHATFMKVINPDNGATITGEAGDNIGRGNRTSIYFKDESAHYEHPELIEASLGDTTECQIDISSVNGVGNVFYNRRHAGIEWYPDHKIETGFVRVFILDWKDHPAKDQAWYERRKEKAKRDGLLHKFLQEVDRDYAASVKGLLIEPKWFKASINAAEKLGIEITGKTIASLDVGDSEDGDPCGSAVRKGIELVHAEEWVTTDTSESAQKCLKIVKRYDANDFFYDAIGVGSGIKGETNRLKKEKNIRLRWPKNCRVIGWVASRKCINPKWRIVADDYQSMRNEDYFPNLKAQGCWELRRRFERTYQAVEGTLTDYDPDELISINPNLPNLHDIERQVCQPTFKENGAGKLTVNKKPNNSRSPNLFDAIMMNYHPVKPPKVLV